MELPFSFSFLFFFTFVSYSIFLLSFLLLMTFLAGTDALFVYGQLYVLNKWNIIYQKVSCEIFDFIGSVIHL